ncbi:MAG: hypothetical protein NVSMB70_00620 [Chamaesiphon sp.]
MFRELKGHLKPRKLAIAILTSLLGQLLTLFYFYSQLPGGEATNSEIHNHYCTGTAQVCLRDAFGHFEMNWALWWLDIFRAFSYILPFILIVSGVYMLIKDLAQEEHRGTLNFIRLSPQPSQKILTGKILGVPMLLYLAIALAVPLHWVSAIASGVSFILVLSLYVLFGAVCYFFYSAALLYAFLGGLQPGLGSVLSVVFGLPCVQIINFYLYVLTEKNFNLIGILPEKLQWFYLPIGSQLTLTYSFTLLNFVLWTYWIWQGLNRRFANPSATLINKKQSYWLVGCFQILILGFLLPALQFNPSNFDLLSYLGISSTLNLIGFLVLMAALSPQRQVLQDWARYRRDKVSTRKGFWSRSLLEDLIWGEKSPALLAIALSLVITAIIWISWILLWPADSHKIQAICGLLLSLNLILIYAAISEFLLFVKTPKRNIVAASTVGVTMLLPPILVSLFAHGQPQGAAAGLLLFSPFLWMALDHVAKTTIFLVLLGQWSILGLLSLQLMQKVRRVGESVSKTLLASHLS